MCNSVTRHLYTVLCVPTPSQVSFPHHLSPFILFYAPHPLPLWQSPCCCPCLWGFSFSFLSPSRFPPSPATPLPSDSCRGSAVGLYSSGQEDGTWQCCLQGELVCKGAVPAALSLAGLLSKTHRLARVGSCFYVLLFIFFWAVLHLPPLASLPDLRALCPRHPQGRGSGAALPAFTTSRWLLLRLPPPSYPSTKLISLSSVVFGYVCVFLLNSSLRILVVQKTSYFSSSRW